MSEPLTAAQRVAIARHPQRPNITDYIQALFTDFFEQKGDRLCGEDAAILGGVALYHGRPVTVIGTRKGKTLEENLKCNFGMPNPEGYRKALRLMRQAEKFRRPILTFIDTSGAYPGLEAEAHGQGEAIARNLYEMSRLTVPVIALITGEGNSGGALVNTKGELVGINTLIQSRSGTYIGYAFAVPTSIVKKVVVDLKEHGVVQRAMLGIQYIPLTEEFLETEEGKKTGIQEPGGIYVAEVDPEGAAHAAGIRSGDVIVEINGIKIDGSAQLSEEIAKHRPNDKVTVGVKKGSDVKQIEVVLRNKAGNTEVITKDIVSAYDALGGQFAEVSERTKKALKIGGGVQVVGIEPGGILESARIRKGYIITNINDRPVRSIGDLNRITSKIEYIEGVYPDGRVVAYSPTVK